MSDNKQHNSAPVMKKWRSFTFRSERAAEETVHAGIDKDGNIWLDLKDVRSTVLHESGAALDLDKFDELVRELPETQYREILASVPDVRGSHYDLCIRGITPEGLRRVLLQVKHHQSWQVSKAASYVWGWLIQIVYEELYELADKQREAQAKTKAEAEALQCEDLPDEERDVAAKLPVITEQLRKIQFEQVIIAARHFWDRLESDVFPQLRKLADNHRQKANIQEVK